MPQTAVSPVLPVIHFFLLPDRNSARRVRREIAQRGGALDLVVGTWLELLDQAQKAYLLPEPVSDWDDRLARASTGVADAFWSASARVAPDQTGAALHDVLCFLLEGAGPAGRLLIPPPGTLSARAERHLGDLALLHQAMEFALPPRLLAISDALGADKGRAIRSVSVHHSSRMALTPWQQALIDKLCSDAGPGAVGQEGLFAEVSGFSAAGTAGTSLALIQGGLFGADSSAAPIDASVQCLAARDFLEEVEVAVGMAQQALADDPTLTPAQIGFLVPSDQIYTDALSSVCASAGLPVSGLPTEKEARDLGREAVLNFLLTRRRPVPAMALAALLTSPLMPWGREAANRLAQRVMDGNLDLDAPAGLSFDGNRMLKLLRKEADRPDTLAQSLGEYAALLNAHDGLDVHLARARSTVAKLRAGLLEGEEVPWADLLRGAAPGAISAPASSSLSREGMAVFCEQEEPWRQVRQLFVLGFSNGRYPGDPARSAIFSDADISRLKDVGYAVETPGESSRLRRTLFQRQVGSASRRVVFLIPRRDSFGKELRPSRSLTYMAKLFSVADPDDLIRELERSSDRTKTLGLALAPAAVPLPPRQVRKRDLYLNGDLLMHRDGTPKPQSPSSLETLMVSPLAWLLSRSGLQPREWAPESLDVAAKGTLAHDVFEHLFRPARPLPAAGEVTGSVPALLDDAIRRKMPFLHGPEWQVERRHLQRDIEIAAHRWSELLEALGAKVLGNEVALSGTLDAHPIRGSADLLLELPGGRLYVVDYKKAGSSARRQRMLKGYDHQASLYRLMIETGGGGADADAVLKQAIDGAQEIGVAYYMLNDQMALTDSSGWVSRQVTGVEELGEGIADNAMALIRSRIDQLKAGTVRLNHEDDPKRFKDDAAITMYALDVSPLIGLFMKTNADQNATAPSLAGEDQHMGGAL